MKMMKYLLPLFLLTGGSATATTALFDLFPAGDRPTEVLLLHDGQTDHDPTAKRPAELRFTDLRGTERAFALRLSERGRFRRKFCDHAPLKLDFRKRDLRAAGLAEWDKYKLVGVCHPDDPKAEALVLREYLAYRAYRLITPFSYRVRLLRITHRDPSGAHPDRSELAFLLENTPGLAHRTGTDLPTMVNSRRADRYDPMAEAVHGLFQYLLGNTDWSGSLGLNQQTLVAADGQLVPVAYDFDFSAWVGAPYARPKSEIGQRSLRERHYLGFAQPDELLRTAAAAVLAQRDALTALVREAPLDAGERRRLLRHLRNGLDEIESLAAGSMIYAGLRRSTKVPVGGDAADFVVM